MKISMLEKFGIRLPMYYPDSGIGPIGGGSDIGIMNEDNDTNDKDDATGDDDDKEDKDDKTDEDIDKEDEEGDEDNEDDVDTDKEDDETDTDKEDDDKDDKEDDKETDEETQRLTSYTDIKKVYPDFFKKFPGIRAALFRDERYGEMFASPDEAQNTVDKAATYDQLSEDIVGKGDIVKLLDVVHKNNEKSFEKIAYNLLPYLQEKHKDLYLEIAAVPIKQLLRSAYREGGGKDGDLGRAALHIHKFFFNDLEIAEKAKAETSRTETKSAKEQELENKLNEINNKEQAAFNKSVDTSYLVKMRRDISAGLEKDERITPYMMNKLVDDILLDIRNQLTKDSRYVTTMKSLFSQAKGAGLSDNFKTRIVSTSLARAKALIPATRARIVSDALKRATKGNGKDKDKDDTKRNTSSNFTRRDERQTSSHRERSEQRSSTSGNGNKKPLTDIDILRSR